MWCEEGCEVCQVGLLVVDEVVECGGRFVIGFVEDVLFVVQFDDVLVDVY